MAAKRFSLRFLLGATAALAVIFAALSCGTFTACLLTTAVFALAGALLGELRGGRSIAYGALGGGSAPVLLIWFYWPSFVLGYFYADDPGEYFEDGAFIEIVMYPMILTLMYATIGALLGFLAGCFVWLLARSFHVAALRFRSPPKVEKMASHQPTTVA